MLRQGTNGFYKTTPKTKEMNLHEEFTQLKDNLLNLNPESKLVATITAENTGELMDVAIKQNKQIVKPFTESADQNFYYFIVEVKKNVFLRVKSEPKKYRDEK